MNKKTLRWILMIPGILVVATGLVMRFALHNSAVVFDAPALCVIGLALSLEYKAEKYRVVVRIFQALSMLLIVTGAVSWFADLASSTSTVLRLAAIAVNLPLAALGLKRNEKS